MLELSGKQVVCVMGRIGAAGAAAVLAVFIVAPAPMARAELAQSRIQLAQATPPDAPRRRVYRPQERLRVTPNSGYETTYPRYNPGPNAVRVCNAHYEQEYRPSGTVIVPKMHCVWSNDPRARAVAD